MIGRVHHIVGSEADQPRPMAYLRRGRTRRGRRRRPLRAAVLAGAAALVSVAAVCSLMAATAWRSRLMGWL